MKTAKYETLRGCDGQWHAIREIKTENDFVTIRRSRKYGTTGKPHAIPVILDN